MSPPPEHSGLAGLLQALLGYMSTPWRAVVGIVVLVLVGAGFILWHERAYLREALMARGQAPSVVSQKVEPQLDLLMTETTADIALIWAVDIAANSAVLRGARERGDRVWTFQPKRLAVLAETSDVRLVSQVLAGQTACEAIPVMIGPVPSRLRADGLTWWCFAPISPGANRLVGAILLAWRQKPAAPYQSAAIAVAAQAAHELIR